jgi:hypothetical protein
MSLLHLMRHGLTQQEWARKFHWRPILPETCMHRYQQHRLNCPFRRRVKKILTSCLQMLSILFRSHFQESRPVSYKGIARNRKTTHSCPETWVSMKLRSSPTKGIRVSG